MMESESLMTSIYDAVGGMMRLADRLPHSSRGRPASGSRRSALSPATTADEVMHAIDITVPGEISTSTSRDSDPDQGVVFLLSPGGHNADCYPWPFVTSVRGCRDCALSIWLWHSMESDAV